MALDNSKASIESLTPSIKQGNLNLKPSQMISDISDGVKQIVSVIPSNNTPTFGSQFILDIKETAQILHSCFLLYNVSAISGRTGDATGYPAFVPAQLWASQYVIKCGNSQIGTYFPEEQFITTQLFAEDSDRVYFNQLQGAYNSISQRGALSATTSDWYVPLNNIINVCHLPILTQNHQLQLQVTLRNLSQIISLSGGTGTASASINYVRLVCRVSKIPNDMLTRRLNSMAKNPEHSFYHKIQYSIKTIPSGVTTHTEVLNAISGRVAFLFFIIRNTNSLTGENLFSFNAIKEFDLRNSASQSMVGGSLISHQMNQQLLMPYWVKSSYLTENSIGRTLYGDVENNNANIYMWSFTNNPDEAYSTGKLLGSEKFSGAEQLILNFSSATASTANLEVFAFTEALYTQGVGSVAEQNI